MSWGKGTAKFWAYGEISQEILFSTPTREQVVEIKQDVSELQESVSSLAKWSEDIYVELTN